MRKYIDTDLSKGDRYFLESVSIFWIFIRAHHRQYFVISRRMILVLPPTVTTSKIAPVLTRNH